VNRPLLILILAATAVRLAFGAAIGLGVDESYMVAAGRVLSLGYFDHPPASWWLSHGGAALFGTEAPLAVRLPFILLFALTTWLIARIAEQMSGPRAGFWAAMTLNLSPVFGVTSGGWVLPDGPLDCALAGAALCLMNALPARGRAAAAYWCGAGICAGLALFSKYSAVLTIAGAFLFLLTSRHHRIWLTRWEPYAAMALALLVFSPVIIWNATHDWASFAFQGARAGGARFRPLAPLETWAGEALFVLPWIWLPMMALWIRGFRGPWRERLLAWLASGPILVFALISAWSSQRILFHWAAPGYLMLFPLLGAWVAARVTTRSMRLSLAGTAALILTAMTVVGVQETTDLLEPWMPAKDPTAEGIDWTSLREEATSHGALLPGMAVGVPNWRDAGKIGVGLGPGVPILCLSADARQFRFASPLAPWRGRTILLLSPDDGDRAIPALAGRFERIERLTPMTVTLGDRVVKRVNAAIGYGFRGDQDAPAR
jgi:4-amino-4-deoxy-L-arabinose transferase-like glycosyltransferase